METFIKFNSGYETTDKTVNFQVKLIRMNKNNGFSYTGGLLAPIRT